MVSGDCIFCKIIAGSIPCYNIYEDDDTFAFLDIGPLSDGHTLVVPKKHFSLLHNCPAKVLGSLNITVGKIGDAISRALEIDGYNVLCNNGRSAGQLVDHVHFHIIPRITGDGVFDKWLAKKYEEDKPQKIVRLIKEKLDT